MGLPYDYMDNFYLICAGEFDPEEYAAWQDKLSKTKNTSWRPDSREKSVQYQLWNMVSDSLLPYIYKVIKNEHDDIFDLDVTGKLSPDSDFGLDPINKSINPEGSENRRKQWMAQSKKVPVTINNVSRYQSDEGPWSCALDLNAKDKFVVTDKEMSFVLDGNIKNFKYADDPEIAKEFLGNLEDAFQDALTDFVDYEGLRDVFPDGIVCYIDTNPWSKDAHTQKRRTRW